MLIAQISDLHLRTDGVLIHNQYDTHTAVERCVAHINRLTPKPDVVLATGDLTDDGSPADYARLRQLLDRLTMPCYVIPGNHDDRANLRMAFADLGYIPDSGDFLHYALEEYAMRLIGLDTLLPGELGGGLCPQRLAWLEARLEEQPGRPTLIFMHHPPFPSGIRFLDSPSFEGALELQSLISAHRQIRQIVCGHIHRDISAYWAGTCISIAPSCLYQMNLELRHGGTYQSVKDSPALSLYLWENDVGPVGYTSFIE